MENVIETIVRSTEVDMIGHLNNAKYLEYMEWGRFAWIDQLGLPLEAMRARGILPVVVNINVNYRKEVRMGERIKIVSKPLRRGEKSFVLRHELYNEAAALVCDADVTMVMIDAATRRATAIPEEISRLYDRLRTE
ncbi:acyl-CoA thioesterase [Brevibacillus marinus]|uniref:acyl-CoA thioesterase n=1 Tax=Brevibacillus marinus TaxID=2496837 RepID=UPI000F827462|nr:thioesterase family protein [Brevibacillus marinus]